jgi:hypothetical protein
MLRAIFVFAAAMLMPLTSARATDYPDTAAGLESFTNDVLAALKDGKTDQAKELLKDIAVPDADTWFAKTWGEETGKKLSAKYAKLSKDLPEAMLKVFKSQLEQNRTNVKAYKLESADDKEATGLQRGAMNAMKVKVPLYGVRLVAPGKEAGMHLWSFVYVDGKFRMVGKLSPK